MSSQPITPQRDTPQPTTPSRRSLRFKAGVHLSGLVLIALFAAVALAYAGYKLHQLNSAAKEFALLSQRYQLQVEAITRLSAMENAFNRFLLDGNSANQALLETNRQSLEQMAQQNEDAKKDDLLQKALAREQQWYPRAQQLIEERKRLAPNQGLTEEFLNHYRTPDPSLGVINFQSASQDAYNQGLQSLLAAQNQAAWTPFLAYLVAAALVVTLFPLAPAAFRSMRGLHGEAGQKS
jgi:hypothetical protein